MTKYSSDYHQYVFRDGMLIADFENMYRYSEAVPWNQDKQENWIDLRLTTEMLRDIAAFDEVHDLSCGLGYYLDLIKRLLEIKGRGFGYDISETACSKATNLFPEYNFTHFDLTNNTNLKLSAYSQCRKLFIIRGTMWYVFPKIAVVVDNIRQMMSANDQLLVVQNFPPLHTEFIGKKVIPDQHALVRYFKKSFTVVRHMWYEDMVSMVNDNWFMGLFSPEVGE